MFKKNMNFTTFYYQSSDVFLFFCLLLNLFYIQYFNMKVAISYRLYLIFFLPAECKLHVRTLC